MDAFSYASLANLAGIEQLYQSYLKDPASVDLSWRHFFEGMSFASSAMPSVQVTAGKESLRP